MENAGGGTEKSQSSTTQGSSSINPAAPSSSLSPPASTAGSPTFVRERERDGRQFIPVLVSEKSSASRSAKLERRLSPLNPYANISNFTAPTSIPSQLTTKTSAVDIPEPSRTSFDEGPSPSLVSGDRMPAFLQDCVGSAAAFQILILVGIQVPMHHQHHLRDPDWCKTHTYTSISTHSKTQQVINHIR
ncbi:hypothetical protein BC829DRAFT_91789 [Chytridium lagenaria]|nr:hypothetical protein BC829DRAFT_91789 [Chytridium lagenaria]